MMNFLKFLRRSPRKQAYPPMPFVIGAPRSGTTLLRFMIDAHPQLCIPPETGFLCFIPEFEAQAIVTPDQFIERVTHFPVIAPNWEDMEVSLDDFKRELNQIKPFNIGDGYRTFYKLYAEIQGKPRWGDKTPTYFRYIDGIKRNLPEARFIYIIRDGRDVALSLRDLWFSPGRDVETLAEHWKAAITTARAQGQGKPYYLEVYYEELLVNTEEVLRKICDFIELDFHPEMLNYYQHTDDRMKFIHTRYRTDGTVLATRDERLKAHRLTFEKPDPSRIGVWKHEMSREEQKRYEAVAGDVLKELGYELTS